MYMYMKIQEDLGWEGEKMLWWSLQLHIYYWAGVYSNSLLWFPVVVVLLENPWEFPSSSLLRVSSYCEVLKHLQYFAKLII